MIVKSLEHWEDRESDNFLNNSEILKAKDNKGNTDSQVSSLP